MELKEYLRIADARPRQRGKWNACFAG